MMFFGFAEPRTKADLQRRPECRITLLVLLTHASAKLKQTLFCALVEEYLVFIRTTVTNFRRSRSMVHCNSLPWERGGKAESGGIFVSHIPLSSPPYTPILRSWGKKFEDGSLLFMDSYGPWINTIPSCYISRAMSSVELSLMKLCFSSSVFTWLYMFIKVL